MGAANRGNAVLFMKEAKCGRKAKMTAGVRVKTTDRQSQMKHDGVRSACFALGGKVSRPTRDAGDAKSKGSVLDAKAPLAQSDRQTAGFLP